MKRYLVTGGTGFIGSSLVRRLIKEKYNVRILDNNERGIEDRLRDIRDGIEIIRADVRDPKSVSDACDGVDGVFHLAYVNGTEFFYKKPDIVLDVGVKGMVNVIDGCIRHGVKEFFLASSSEVYQTPPRIPTDENVPLVVPDPFNPRYSYGGGKIISELMAINYGRTHFRKTVIFRPHNVYGPDMGWEHVIPQFVVRMKRICSERRDKEIEFPIQGTGNETRSFVFIDDFIDGLMFILKKGENMGIYHIGTMEEVKIADLARYVGGYFGRRVKIVPGKPAEGGTTRRCPDISRLMALGYKPKIPLKEGLRITAEWYDKNAFKSPSFR